MPILRTLRDSMRTLTGLSGEYVTFDQNVKNAIYADFEFLVRDNTKARESILEEDLAKDVSLSLHNSFCLNRESRVKALPNQAKRLQEQREWMRSYEQLKAWEEIVISSDDEEELLRQFAVSSTSGCSTSKAKSAR